MARGTPSRARRRQRRAAQHHQHQNRVEPGQHYIVAELGSEVVEVPALAAGASGATDLPLSDRDTDWDSDAAKQSLTEGQYADAHFWRDPEGDPDVLSSYKLPFARNDGGLEAVWRGVTAAAAALQGARGGVSIPQGDVSAVRSRIDRYYSAARGAYDDPEIRAPWDEASENAEAAGETATGDVLEAFDDLAREEIAALAAQARGEYAIPEDADYRPADSPEVSCAACEYFAAEGDGRMGMCSMFEEMVRADYVCDEFETAEEPDEGEDDDAAISAAVEVVLPEVVAPEPGVKRWQALLCPEAVLTEDGRAFAPGSITWRDLPLSLMAMLETQEGHDGAHLCGRIDQVWRLDDPETHRNLVMGAGVFDEGEFGSEVARLVAEGHLRGNSVDIAILEFEVGPRSDYFDDEGRWIAGDLTRRETADEDEPSLEDLLLDGGEDTIFVVTKGVIGCSTVCPFPAFADASISLVADARWRLSVQGGYLVTSAPFAVPAAATPEQRRDALARTLTAAGVESAPVEPQTVYDLAKGSLGEREFYVEVLRSGFRETRHAEWPCEAELGDHGEVLYRDATEGVFRLDSGALAHATLRGGWMHVCVASDDRDIATGVVDTFAAAYPALFRDVEGGMVPITFWAYNRSMGYASSRLRLVGAQSWEDIAGNYTAAVRAELERMVGDDFEPGAGGQLLLWQGPPGTGKTWALRALASEWRDWAEFHYIMDPDAFFGSEPSYMRDVLLSDSYEELTVIDGETELVTSERGGKWRVLILEDTGELLAANAKDKQGQGLSRLLNAVDGMIGQGLRVLCIITTNDQLDDMHPAAVRPGRCASQVVFSPLDAAEALAWLSEREPDVSFDPDRFEQATLAELYARLHDVGGVDGTHAFAEDDGDEPVLTASAAGLAPLRPPAEWFETEEVDELTALTITDDGHIYGHAAAWNTCHIGIPGVCTTAPNSPSGYAWFHLGHVLCDDDSFVDAGKITLDTGHADKTLGRAAATAHYDHSGTVVADVRATDGEHGIWITGAIRPNLDASRLRELRAAVLSGDWRNVDGALELVALLAVNVPGFPVPRTPRAVVASAADGAPEVLTLIAAGITTAGTEFSALERERLRALAAQAQGEYETLRAEAHAD